MHLIDNCSFLPESTKLMADALGHFCDEHIAPIADEIDQNARFPIELWPKLGQMGLLGLTVAQTDGGSGMSYLDHVIAMSIISSASASVGLAYGAHSNLCVNQIARFATGSQKKRFLTPLIQGDWVGALAMSETQAGSDVMSMQTTAEEKDEHFVLNGQKMWITNGMDAHVIIVYARTDPEAGSKGLSAFLVTKDNPGWQTAQKIDKLGMRGAHACELVFKNCIIPKDQLLGPLNKGTEVLMSGLDLERLVLAGGPLGIMDACLKTTLPYIHERKQFGKAIGEFQMIQAKVADMYTHFHAAKAFVYQTALMAQSETLSRQAAASCILFASEKATQMALDTIQILGGNGYTNDYPAGRLLRDAKLYEIGAGTSEIRRMLIGRELFLEHA